MVFLMVILTIVVFLLVDILSRVALKRYQDARARREREQALDIGLRLDYTDEAPSLKRVAVDRPKARILAVDDEAIVLDSFRKILVIAGYSIDTVETGPEAIGLVRKRDYDFVFTDLKMPEMDGLEVTKAVKHLRPDVDVIIITGYATIESAVSAMKYGAMDYVEKPFTAEELTDFVNKSLIRREHRIEQEIRPQVHLITPSSGPSDARRTFNVPSGVFVSPTHTWLRVSMNGLVSLGIDDFALKLIEDFDAVDLPELGRRVAKGDPLFAVIQGDHRLAFPAPVSGRVTTVNKELLDEPELIRMKPYELGWLCVLDPSNLPEDLQSLRIGAEAVSWYQEEIDKFYEVMHGLTVVAGEEPPDELERRHAVKETDGEERWEAFSQAFLKA